MDEYKKIFEVYKHSLLNEGNYGTIYMQQRQSQIVNGLSPKPDGKNSFGGATATGRLPAGVNSKISDANVGSSAPATGFEDEEIAVKGYGRMSRKQLQSLYDKVMAQAHSAKKENNTTKLIAKLDLLNVLAKHM